MDSEMVSLILTVILFLFVFNARVVYRCTKQSAQVREALRQVNKKIGGNIRAGFPFFSYSSLVFNHKGREVRVLNRLSYHLSYHRLLYRDLFSPAETYIVTKTGGLTDLYCRIAADGLLGRFCKFIVVPDFRIGNPTFDDAFLIWGSSEPFIKSLLTPELQEMIYMVKGTGLWITIYGGKLSIRSPQLMTDSETLSKLLDIHTKCLDRMIESGAR